MFDWIEERGTDLRQMVQERRVGFRMDETMTGTHEFEADCGPRGTFPFEFRITWGPKDLAPWLNPRSPLFMTQPLSGRVTMGGLCEDVPCEGQLKLRYFTKRTIRYSFRFTADGKDYDYVGEKVNILPWNLPTSHTTCFGTVKEVGSGKLVSRSVTHFRFKTLVQFLASFRLG